MKRELIASAACLALTSCASVDSVPLNSNGTEDKAQVHGILYYMPAPYLLITELPVAPQTPSGNGNNGTGAAGAGGGGGGAGGGGTGQTGQSSTGNSSSAPQSSTPAAPASDTSFSASMVQYSIKLVYLPDLSKPRALQMHSGLLGSVTAAPSLTDGWMLTGMNGSSNAGVSDTLTALAGLLGGGSNSTGGKSGGTAALTAAAGAAAAGPPATPAILSPGDSDNMIETTGKAVGSGTESAPLSASISALSDAQKQIFIKGILEGIESRPAQAASTTQTIQALPWGNNVLPAGLYQFVYSPVTSDHSGGQLTGIKPVAYFCKNGVHAADGPCIHDNGSLLPQ